MHIGVFVADFSYVLGIVLNMLMYMSGIFYSFDNLTPPYGMILQNVNPVAFLLTSMRQALMYSQTPNMIVMIIWALISMLLAIFGTMIIYKNENNYVKVI